MPMRDELQILDIDLSDRQSAIGDGRSGIVATVSNPEFGMIALFCAVGLWLTFYYLHLFQSFAAFGTIL